MILNKLRNFLYGRYNKLDALNITMLIFSFLLSMINSRFITNPIASFAIWFLSTALAVFTFFRLLSKDIYKRQHENDVFKQKTLPISNTYKLYKVKFKERKINRIVVCPVCKTMLRLPKGKKNIQVTCGKCKNKFDA